eukprot:CAMPEP_0197518612 /NCGR_PEP_ID=MMETSP1318-20131121/3838_1 /TAXON_ID=552666 /ORGANISM="Partenskyella glossopodia, Strain RCC365" /LENGTH=198 /DNA_ID=CAMNT_0043069097 /DNA_START=229 /DNA_END=822 /DNA_ORIENTATION=+
MGAGQTQFSSHKVPRAHKAHIRRCMDTLAKEFSCLPQIYASCPGSESELDYVNTYPDHVSDQREAIERTLAEVWLVQTQGTRSYILKMEFVCMCKCYLKATAAGLDEWVRNLISALPAFASTGSSCTSKRKKGSRHAVKTSLLIQECLEQSGIFRRLILEQTDNLSNAAHKILKSSDDDTVEWNQFRRDFIDVLEVLW